MTQHEIRGIDQGNYNPIHNTATDLTSTDTSDEELNGYRYSLFHIIWNQLTTPAIRESMHWLSFRDRDDGDKVFWQAITKWKLCRDAFAFESGRSNIVVSFTNCSLQHCCNTYYNADIVSINDVEEDKFNLHLVSQQCEKELTILRIIGIPDPHSGVLLGVYASTIEDTGALEKTLGRGSPLSSGKWLYSKFGPGIHVDDYLTKLAPISIDAKMAQEEYIKLITTKLQRRCVDKGLNPHLVQFYREPKFRRGAPKHKEYIAEWTNLSKQAKHYLYTYGQWLTANSIHALPLEPLHCELRISTHTIKWVVIFAFEYYQWMNDDVTRDRFNEINHSGTFVPQTREQVLRHFRECCCLVFSMPNDGDDLGSLTIKNSYDYMNSKAIYLCDYPCVNRGSISQSLHERITAVSRM